MRDKRIDEIVLNSADYKIISPQFCEEHIGSSYIFCSVDSVLSSSLLTLLLQKFYCSKKENNPCFGCDECNKIANRTNIDVEYFGVKNENIKKDEIKFLLENAITRPYENGHKFLVIENGENLSELVQNLLLKTLEELPTFTTIIILANSISKILPTIQSRCQTYQLKPLNRCDCLRIIGSSERSLHIADVADGVLSKALLYFEQGKVFEEQYKYALKLLHNFCSSAEYVQYVEYLNNNKENIKNIIEVAQSVFRLAMVEKISCTTEKKKLAKIVQLCNYCIDEINKNVLTNVVIDKFLLGILKSKLGD